MRSASRCVGSGLVLGRVRLQVLALQFHLLEQAGLPLRAGAVELPSELLDLKRQMCDQRGPAGAIRLGGAPGAGSVRRRWSQPWGLVYTSQPIGGVNPSPGVPGKLSRVPSKSAPSGLLSITI